MDSKPLHRVKNSKGGAVMLRKIWFLIRLKFKEKFIIPRAVKKKKKIKRGNRIIEIPDVESYIYALPKGLISFD